MNCIDQTTAALLSFCLVFAAGEAQAQEASMSEGKQMFQEAVGLAKAYRHSEACRLMEKSYEIEPSFTTKYWLGRCKTTIGHLASASQIYHELRDELAAKSKDMSLPEEERENHKKRVAAIDKDLAGFEGDIPKINVVVPAEVSGLPGVSVLRNETEIPMGQVQQPWMLDPGNYTIAVRAPDYADWSSVTKLENGETLQVDVPMLVRQEEQEESDPGAVHRALGWTGIGVGGAALIGGGVLAVIAKLEYDSTADDCDDIGCTADARDIQKDATVKADVATVLILGGAAVAGAGAIVLLTAPEQPEEEGAGEGTEGVTVTASVGPGSLMLNGTW